MTEAVSLSLWDLGHDHLFVQDVRSTGTQFSEGCAGSFLDRLLNDAPGHG